MRCFSQLSKTLQETTGNHINTGKSIHNMPSRKRIPEETKAVIKVLKTTTDLTLEKIAKQFKVSIASVHRIITTKDKVPENS